MKRPIVVLGLSLLSLAGAAAYLVARPSGEPAAIIDRAHETDVLACEHGRLGCRCPAGTCIEGECRRGICEGEPCPTGTSRCACAPNGRCQAGMSCRGGLCVAPGDPLGRSYFYSPRSDQEVERVHELILAKAGFTAGMRVADVGAGEGPLTSRVARIVGPTGRVYATDIDDGAIAALRRRAARAERGAAPIEVRKVPSRYETALDDLPARSLDRILIINAFGLSPESPRDRHLPQLRAFANLLRDDGELLYHQDWLTGELEAPALAKLFAEAGLRLLGEFDLGAVGMPSEAERYAPGLKEVRKLRRGYLLRFGPARAPSGPGPLR